MLEARSQAAGPKLVPIAESGERVRFGAQSGVDLPLMLETMATAIRQQMTPTQIAALGPRVVIVFDIDKRGGVGRVEKITEAS